MPEQLPGANRKRPNNSRGEHHVRRDQGSNSRNVCPASVLAARTGWVIAIVISKVALSTTTAAASNNKHSDYNHGPHVSEISKATKPIRK